MVLLSCLKFFWFRVGADGQLFTNKPLTLVLVRHYTCRGIMGRRREGEERKRINAEETLKRNVNGKAMGNCLNTTKSVAGPKRRGKKGGKKCITRYEKIMTMTKNQHLVIRRHALIEASCPYRQWRRRPFPIGCQIDPLGRETKQRFVEGCPMLLGHHTR